MIPILDINDILIKWASNEPPIVDFTVENVLAAVGLNYTDYNEVYHYLMSKNGYELIAKKMILCPNNHKGDTFELNEPVDDQLFDCFCVEDEFEATNLLLVFSFTENFISGALKKKVRLKMDILPQNQKLILA